MRSRLWICSTVLLLPLAACTGSTDPTDPSGEPEPDAPSSVQTATPSEDATPVTETPEPEPVLTFKNSRDLAILLAGPSSGPSVARFTRRYEGQLIEFDATVSALADDGSPDVLVTYGDHGTTKQSGPTFRLQDVGGPGPSVGDDIRVVARVESYDQRARLLVLDPVSASPPP